VTQHAIVVCPVASAWSIKALEIESVWGRVPGGSGKSHWLPFVPKYGSKLCLVTVQCHDDSKEKREKKLSDAETF
jgi:hypothetical protein